jgi:hypothetical protein
MRSTPLRFAFAVALLAGLAAVAPAQFGLRPKVKIENVRIGFRPAGGNERTEGTAAQPVFKAGLWAPLSFGLEILDETDRGMRLEVTAFDGDGMRTVTSTPIVRRVDVRAGEQPRAKGSKVEPTEMLNPTLVRVGGESGDVTLRVVSDDDDRRTLSDSVTLTNLRDRPVSKYVVLSLGATVPGLGFPRPDRKPGEEGDAQAYLRNGRVELARVESVQEMPDQWFGYEAADLVVVGTGKADKAFVDELMTGTTATANRKRWALFEWVRRGGRLVLSVGDKADEVRASVAFADILPVTVGQAARLPELRTKAFGSSQFNVLELRYPPPRATEKNPTPKPDLLPVAALTPVAARSPRVLLTDADGKRVLVAQTPLGLGRVTVVGFDLDRSPFADHPKRADFWDWLVDSAGSERAAEVPATKARAANTSAGNLSAGGPEDGVAAAVRSNVDAFEGVPVISFGWVALFILGYTLLIGPLEYLFLKKVLGRLELTWVTFPLIVLTVSGAAYFTAYAVKGKDLRINKIDVIDLDPRGDGRVYGRTWFTIFSPRIDSYTIGVEPKDNWAKVPPAGPVPPTVVDWFGGTGGNTAFGGSARSYRYQFDPLTDDGRPAGPANGLVGVPIQVWTTKAFTANWSGIPGGTKPPVESDLAHLPAGGIGGSITLNLPLKDVFEAFVIYRGNVYEFEKGVSAGVPVRLSLNKPVDPSPLKPDDRFFANDRDDSVGGFAPRGRRAQPTTTTQTGPLPLWGLLFHEHASVGRESLQNSTLRGLDQSWRLTDANTDEVILLFRLKRASGPAEPMMADPESASPTRLWLTTLPGGGQRAEVPGLMQQDTYLRVFLPVKKAGEK